MKFVLLVSAVLFSAAAYVSFTASPVNELAGAIALYGTVLSGYAARKWNTRNQ
ncbi:MAG: hypothetical protein WCJ25_02635 [Candidatus Moraniibacteriota bacterium]